MSCESRRDGRTAGLDARARSIEIVSLRVTLQTPRRRPTPPAASRDPSAPSARAAAAASPTRCSTTTTSRTTTSSTCNSPSRTTTSSTGVTPRVLLPSRRTPITLCSTSLRSALRRPVCSVALPRPPRAPRLAPRLALAFAPLAALRRLGVPPRTARAPLPPLLLPLAPLEEPSDVPAGEIERSDRARGVAPAARVALLEVEGVARPAEPVPGGGLLALGALAVARLVVVREEIVARGIRPGRTAVEAVSGALPGRGAPVALVGVDVPAVRAIARALQELAAQPRVRHRARLRWV